MDTGTRTTDGRVRVDEALVAVVPLPFNLAKEERDWYLWLVRELLNGVLIARRPDTLGRLVEELDEVIHELIARIPPR